MDYQTGMTPEDCKKHNKVCDLVVLSQRIFDMSCLLDYVDKLNEIKNEGNIYTGLDVLKAILIFRIEEKENE